MIVSGVQPSGSAVPRHLFIATAFCFTASACGGGQSSTTTSSGSSGASSETTNGSSEGGASGDEFQLSTSEDADQAHGEHPSEIEATRTQAAMRLFVVDPNTGPIEGIVIKFTAPDGSTFYTGQTDSLGYAEVLVPVGQRYDIEYLSLGRRNTSASVEVDPGPNQDIRLTMRYRRRQAAPPSPDDEAEPEPEGIVLDGILFESGRATIEEESYPRLDRVVEYMTYRITTRIRIAGHTDNVGNARRNQQLSEARANAVRDYLVEHGIDRSRVEAVGLGDQQPVAPNSTEEGRRRNRRIEAIEL